MSSIFKDYRVESKKNWGVRLRETEPIAIEQLQTGALLRIADATEAMAKNYIQLQQDVKMYKEWWEQRVATCEKLNRRISALQGVITKLKKKAQ